MRRGFGWLIVAALQGRFLKKLYKNKKKDSFRNHDLKTRLARIVMPLTCTCSREVHLSSTPDCSLAPEAQEG